MTPFIECLNNEKVSDKAHEIAVSGLHHIVSYNLLSDATASTIGISTIVDAVASDKRL